MRTWFSLMLAGAILGDAASPPVSRWEVPEIAGPMWESHPAIDPRTGDLWFVRSGKDFSGWRLKLSRCVHGHWSAPVDPRFAAKGLEADPFFTPDGRTLYFISSRASGEMASAALDIWIAQRTPSGDWGVPERLPEPVNSDAAEWFPRPASDGWLYFGSRRTGGLGKDDIWRAKRDAAGRWTVEKCRTRSEQRRRRI